MKIQMAWGDDVFWQTTQKKTVNSTKNTFCPIPYWDYLLDKKAFSFISTRKNALVEDKGSGILHV
jgi:hypothetical protein